MKNFAFTLAEVLVTLGIIGVVSAMTMPTLIQNHQKTVYVTELHKVYNDFSQAVLKAINDSNAVSLDETKYNKNNPNGAKNFLNDYFKIVKDCGKDTSSCFADSYKSINGTSFTLSPTEAAVVIPSGAAISISQNALGYISSGYHGYFFVQVDTNGPKNPNILGKDLFSFELYSDGKIGDHYIQPEGKQIDAEKTNCITGANQYGSGCISVIINNNWKMDY